MLTTLIRPLWLGAALTFAATAYAQDVTGAGASFPAPIYAKWADLYNKASGARINYQSVGSGAGTLLPSLGRGCQRRSLLALVTTERLESAMAAAANIGLSWVPVNG